jgi:hypothetical protein
MNDLYAKFFMEGMDPQDTDTHWRCYAGKGSWNWRLKFEVTLPMKVPEMARLHAQLWDADVVSYNDMICEATFDLYDWFIKAYKVTLFPHSPPPITVPILKFFVLLLCSPSKSLNLSRSRRKQRA